MIFISPTEHSPSIRALGSVSSLCEQSGVDILSVTSTARIGYQRKEISDFYSSIADGRLQKELLQIDCSPILTHAVLIIEGKQGWTTDGQSTRQYGQRIDRAGFRSIVTSIQLRGIIVHYTDDAEDTANLVRTNAKYLSKQTHTALDRRPKQANPWGRTTTSGFATHLLQSFPGMGPELASRIYNHYGRAPIAWTTTADELARIPGIGPKRAAQLIAALDPGPSTDEGAT